MEKGIKQSPIAAKDFIFIGRCCLIDANLGKNIGKIVFAAEKNVSIFSCCLQCWLLVLRNGRESKRLIHKSCS
jgi:hypothetical protein